MRKTDRPGAAWLKNELRAGRRVARPAILLHLAQLPLALVQAGIAARLLAALLRATGAVRPVAACALFALAALLRAWLGYRAELASVAASAGSRHRLRRQLLDRLIALGPAGLRTHHSAALAGLATDQIDALDGLFARWIPAEALALAGPAVIGIAVLIADPRAGLILIGAGLLVPVAMALSGIGAARAAQRQFTAMMRLQTRFLDRVRGIATIVLAGRAEDEAKALGAAAAELRVRTMRVLRVAFLSSTALDLAMAAALVGITLLAAHRLAGRPGADPARPLFALLLVVEFFAPLRAFAAAYADRMGATSAAGALAAIPAAPEHAAPLPAAPQPTRLIAASGISISFDQVGLTWDAARGPALCEVSFRVGSGETLIIAGPSGAGKSSILELLLGFVRPDQGSILLNGMRIETIVPAALAQVTGWIGQRPLLFAASLADNIRFGRPDATDAAIEAAARRARLGPLIDSLPLGLATRIGEGGYGLSGGQAQRVAIARAFLRDAPLLLLDEPTAHLDPATEAEVLEGLRQLAAGRTVVLVTHSAAAQAFSGRRIELRHGRIVGAAARGAA